MELTSLLCLPMPLMFRHSFVTSCGGFVAAVAVDSPLSFVQLLCVWCKVFSLFLFFIIYLISSLVVQLFGAGAFIVELRLIF